MALLAQEEDSDDEDPKLLLSSLLPVRAGATALGLVAYSQGLWRHLGGCDNLAVSSGRPVQALLLVLAYKTHLVLSSRSS